MADKRAFDPIGYRLNAPTIVERVCISIPVQLIPHLLGVIEPLRWPDAWQGEASAINDTTREIEDLFFRLITREECNTPECEECPDCPDNEDGCMGGALIESEDEEMGQVVTDVQIVGGQIRIFFGPCCYRDIGSAADLAGGGADDPPDDVWEGTDGGETPVYSACGKAAGVVNVVYDIVEAAFSAQGELPWSRIGYVQDQVGIDLDNNWLITLLANAQIGTLAGDSWENVEDTIEKQKILAKLAAWFAADGGGVPTSAAFEEVKQIFKNEIWPDSRWQYFDQAINALGRSDMNAVAVMGATDGTQDCADPDTYDLGETEPGTNGWYLGADLMSEVVSGAGASAVVMAWRGTPVHDTYGIFYRVSGNPQDGNIKRMSQNTCLAQVPGLFEAATVQAWGDSGDWLEQANQTYPFIQISTDAVALVVAGLRGFPAYTRQTGGVDSAVIASPEHLAGQSLVVPLWRQAEENPADFLIELRLIHNTGSPSHL